MIGTKIRHLLKESAHEKNFVCAIIQRDLLSIRYRNNDDIAALPSTMMETWLCSVSQISPASWSSSSSVVATALLPLRGSSSSSILVSSPTSVLTTSDAVLPSTVEREAVKADVTPEFSSDTGRATSAATALMAPAGLPCRFCLRNKRKG